MATPGFPPPRFYFAGKSDEKTKENMAEKKSPAAQRPITFVFN